jgi:hypothetical protein
VNLHTPSPLNSSDEICNGIGMKELESCDHFCPLLGTMSSWQPFRLATVS